MDRPPQEPAARQPVRRKTGEDGPVDYAHRTTVNLAAVIAVLVLGGCLLWIINGLEANRKLERCVQAGRKDCAAIPGVPGLAPRPQP